MEKFINYKKLAAIAKLTIRKAKRDSWFKFCSSINCSTPINLIWQDINKIKGINKIKSISHNYGEWAEKFLEKLTPIDVPLYPFVECKISPILKELECKITYNELLAALKNSKTHHLGKIQFIIRC
jgi:hypothetical protein